MREPRILLRDELFEMVWSEPISKVGPKLGVSDVALAKICRKLDVPRPPRGYWARLQHGYPVEKPSLPNPKKGTPNSYCLQPVRQAEELPALPNRPAPEVTVKARVARYNPIVAELRSELKSGWQDQYGRIRSYHGISVSQASVSRVSRILDALIRALDERSIPTRIGEHGLECIIAGEAIRLELHEPSSRQTPKNQSDYGYPRWEYVPTGKLTLTLGSWYLSGYRTTWSDGKTKSLEEHLGVIVAALEDAPRVILAKKEKQRLERIARARERLCEERRFNLYAFTQERAKKIDELVENIDKANSIRALIEAVESASDAPASTKRLARWADLYADHVDPLVDYRMDRMEEPPKRRYW